MKITVLGPGAWGTAIGNIFAKKGMEVVFYGNDESFQCINSEKRNTVFFPDVELSGNVSFTMDLKKAVQDAEIVVFAVPSKVYREVAKLLDKVLDRKVHLLSLGKGFDPETHSRLSSVIEEEISPEHRYPVTTLLGPSYAEEVIHDMFTLITASSVSQEESKMFQRILSSESFRVYTNSDVIGSEVCSALKNVIAIASGILEGLVGGDNAKAALITRGNAEIMRLGMAMGARLDTFLGLSGIGDLMLTCNSMKSRNFSLGYEIGRRNDASSVLLENKKTVEGVYTSKYVLDIAKKYNVELPITECVYSVLFENAKPSEMALKLMTRDLKSENIHH